MSTAIDPTTRSVPALGGFNLTMLRIELRRILRNRRTVIFTLIMPVLLYLIIGTSLVAYLLWTFALKRLPSASVAVFTNFQPVATALLAWGFTGKPVSPAEILGGLLVIAGITTLQS